MRYAGTFDARADEWSHYLSTPWARVRYDVVAGVLDETIESLRLDRAARVLDLGGGDGADSLLLAQAGCQVTIVDSSRDMLERVRLRADSTGAGSRLRTVVADLPSWTPDQTYDLVPVRSLTFDHEMRSVPWSQLPTSSTAGAMQSSAGSESARPSTSCRTTPRSPTPVRTTPSAPSSSSSPNRSRTGKWPAPGSWRRDAVTSCPAKPQRLRTPDLVVLSVRSGRMEPDQARRAIGALRSAGRITAELAADFDQELA